jgi:uncharacterized protein (DUF736 family)
MRAWLCFNVARRFSSPVGMFRTRYARHFWFPTFLVDQEKRRTTSSSVFRSRKRDEAPRASRWIVAIEAARGGFELTQGDNHMSLIGTFKAAGTEYIGEIFTLTVQVQNVRIVKEDKQASEDSPTHRVFVGRAEIGAGWTKTGMESGREYLSIKLDDASFSQPIHANLYANDDGDYNLIWSRSGTA